MAPKLEDREFSAWNAGYLAELSGRYLEDPASLDSATRSYFSESVPDTTSVEKAICAVRLADAIRKYGHRAARIDPLSEPSSDPALELESYGLEESDLERLPARFVGGPIGRRLGSAREGIAELRRIYCSTRGYDYGHIHEPAQRQWLAETAESERFRPPSDPIDARAILESLTEVEAFETFLQRTMPGRHRFSIEGLDMLVPLLQEIQGEAAESGVRHLVLGMAHRGRLNVLVHVLKKPYSRVMAELRDPESPAGNQGGESGFRGDVVYHMGARRSEARGEAVRMIITLLPNPSHLEAVDPLVLGVARAAETRADAGGPPRLDPALTLPVLVHGDASFPGQGVVAETLNLGQLPAYHVGGTLHVIANNRLGFTTDPHELYGTRYASDPAKGFDIPVLHVNADDPEAVVEAARTANAFVQAFRRDFVIDLVGYRRRGHNESDEPAFTHPLPYQQIESEPTVRGKWAKELVARSMVTEEEGQRWMDEAMGRLREAWDRSAGEIPKEEVPLPRPAAAWPDPAPVSLDRLRELDSALLEVPPGFTLHPKLVKSRERRRQALDRPDERAIDIARAEELAFASILMDGTPIRLTGQDTERGTFSQRHAVLHDFESGKELVPLQALRGARAAFEIANSPLSENAALGFELGYSMQAPERLVIWEAQYGDFINGAQVVVDEFLVSARSKWGIEAPTVLLLPHGYEGQGPDHSSARPERFLALAVGDNFWAVNVTTAAQYFHVLRLQAARVQARQASPLVVFSAKGLLRHPLALSKPRELAEEEFRPVLEAADRGRSEVRRMILCSGRVFVDLEEGRRENPWIAVARLERLHPLPSDELKRLFSSHPGLEEVVWLQEEPENMGAWSFVRSALEKAIPTGVGLAYAGREASASPAEGSHASHKRRQLEIVRQAFSVGAVHREVSIHGH